MALSAKEIFEEKITQKLKDNADKISGMNAVYEFVLTGDDASTWTLDLNGSGEVSEGSKGNADCTVTIKTTDLSDIIEGKLNPQMAFMSGKLKVAGNMGLALKLGNIL